MHKSLEKGIKKAWRHSFKGKSRRSDTASVTASVSSSTLPDDDATSPDEASVIDENVTDDIGGAGAEKAPADMEQPTKRSSIWQDLREDADLHEMWADALDGRAPQNVETEMLRHLVERGVPMNFRHALWKHWCEQQQGILGSLDESFAMAPEKAITQIAKDIPRTMSDLLSESQLEDLRYVLICYAGRNPALGYCQGMNFLLVIFILLGFDRQSAFDGLCVLVEQVCPSYHKNDLGGYVRDVELLGSLVQTHLPNEQRMLETYELPLQVLAMDHFISMSVCRWPIGATVRLYDLALMEGTRALFASFLALLKIYLKGAVDGVTSDVGPEGEITPSDIMTRFVSDCAGGVAKDAQVVLRETCAFLRLVSTKAIKRLRRDCC